MFKPILIWMNSKLDSFVEPIQISQDEKTRLQHYMVFMALGIPTMVIFGGVNLFQHNYLISFFAIVTAVGLIAGLFILRRLKNGAWVYRVNAFLYFCLICYMIVVGGEDGSKALWAYTVPLIICFLLGKKEGGLWASLVATFAVIAFTQPSIFSIEVYPYSTSFQLRFFITYSFCTVISVWLESSRNFFLKQSNAVSADLVKEHEKLKAEIEYRKILEEELKTLARIDPLTGVLNRGAFFSAAQTQWNKHARSATEFSFAILDIDHFKDVNDKYGHPAGDEVLAALSKSCITSIRDFDIFGRVGGEEFAFLFAETGLVEAKEIVDRLRISIESLSVDYDGQPINCTVSIGLYTAVPPNESITRIYKKADLALYQAKGSGRNKICIYQNCD